LLSGAQKIGLGAASIFFVAAGSLHFAAPGVYLKIMPPYVPWPRQMVSLSGAAEIAGGLGLLIPLLRRAAGWGLVALLVAVFTANVYMAEYNIQAAGHRIPQLWLWMRLPLQVLLIGWVLRCTNEDRSGR
jgi:uncharacterized membrane protein